MSWLIVVGGLLATLAAIRYVTWWDDREAARRVIQRGEYAVALARIEANCRFVARQLGEQLTPAFEQMAEATVDCMRALAVLHLAVMEGEARRL